MDGYDPSLSPHRLKTVGVVGAEPWLPGLPAATTYDDCSSNVISMII